MGRFWLIIKAKFSKLLDRAEDPAETLDYSYNKQLELLQNVKKGIADVVTAKKRLQMQQSKLQQQVDKLQEQAAEAVRQGKEDLARLALQRKVTAEAELHGLTAQVEELETQQQSLIEQEEKLRSKIAQFRTKKEVVKAQHQAAQAQVAIGEAAAGIGGEFAQIGAAMQRAEDKIENTKARAAALQELEAAGAFDDVLSLASGAGKDDIDRQLAEGQATSQIESELAALKAQLGPATSTDTAALKEGKPAEAEA